MIKIKIDTGSGAYRYLELLPNLSFEKVNQFFKFGELEYGRTQSFKLPRTPHNEEILENAGIVYENGLLMRREIPCRIQYGAVEKSGKLTLNSCDSTSYSCTLYYELSDLLDWINDRDLTEYGVNWSVVWNYENSHAANDPNVPSKTMDVIPYVSECPEPYMMKNEWCWMPSFNIRRVISGLFSNAQYVTGDYGTRLYGMFDEIDEEDRDRYWMVMDKNSRGDNTLVNFRMVDNHINQPLGENGSVTFTAVKAFTDLYNGGHQHGGARWAWNCNKDITLTVPPNFPSGIILAQPVDRWNNTELTSYYYNLKNGRPVHPLSSGSRPLVAGDVIVIPAETNFNFYSVADLRWVAGYRNWMFSQNYNGGTYNLSVELDCVQDEELMPFQSSEDVRYMFKWNAPDISLVELCKIYGALTDTVLTFEDNELKFLKSAGYHEVEITDCVSFSNIERCVGSWNINEVVQFDDEGEYNVSVKYHTDNTAKEQTTNDRVLGCSAGQTKRVDSYYGDGVFVPAPLRLSIQDCEIDYEDDQTTIKKIKPDMDKPVVAELQDNDIRTLKRVNNIPRNQYYTDICENAMKVKAKWVMPIEEYIKLDHTYRFIYRGRRYAWLDAKWSNGLVEATLQQSTYTNEEEYYINVTYSNGGDAGTSGYAREGETWFVWARPSEGFTFDHWELDGQELAGEGTDFSFVVTGNAHYHAVFLGDECTITTSSDPSGGGQTSGGGTYRAGEICTVRATDAGGYRFNRWTENGVTVSTDRNYSFVVTGDRSLVAVFDQLEKYIVRVSVDPAGAAQYYGDGSYYEGTTCTVGVTANQRAYAFMGWIDLDSGQMVSYNTNYTFVVERDWNLQAKYFGGCTVTTATSPYNAGQTYGDGFYNDGDSVTVGFTPDQRAFTFDHWEYVENPGTSVSSNNPYTFTIHQNTYLVAVCQQQGFKVAVNVTPNGSGTVTGAGEYVSGDTCTLVATPNTGYGFSRYEINGQTVSSNRTYSFTVTGDTVVDAIFYSLGYVVTVAASPSNGGTVTGGGTYQYGQSLTITASPNTGFNFTGWYKNGQLVSTSASYTFTVTQSAAFTAMFQGQKVQIRTSVTPSGSGQTSGGGSYSIGSSCTVSAVPYNGYAFLRWEENSQTVSTSATYTFTVSTARNLVAVFQTKEKHNIRAAVYPAGSGSVIGAGSYYTGDTCTLSAISTSGWEFQSWEESASEVSLANPYTFVVTRDRDLTANYQRTISSDES